jgi:hypothetical protein
VGDFQAERAVVQNTTRERLQFNVRPLHAVVLDVQLRNVTYPVDWSNAVSLKEQASYDITLATQEREQAISRVGDAFGVFFHMPAVLLQTWACQFRRKGDYLLITLRLLQLLVR